MISDIIREAETKMANAIEYAKEEFAAIRTGRAHPAMFAKLTAEYYGTQTPLQQLATFHVPDARVVFDHSLRPDGDGGDREIHPRLRPGRQPIE